MSDSFDVHRATSGSASPLLGSWTVHAVDGAPVRHHAAPTMVFAADLTLGGSAGCNNYSTTYRTADDRLTVDTQIATTLMACDPAIDEQERAFLAVLHEFASGAGRFEVDAFGRLRLTSPSGATIDAGG